MIAISDAFSAFCLWVSVTFPTCSLYPQQKRAYSALHPQAWTYIQVHARRLLRSAVPWISKDHLLTAPVCEFVTIRLREGHVFVIKVTPLCISRRSPGNSNLKRWQVGSQRLLSHSIIHSGRLRQEMPETPTTNTTARPPTCLVTARREQGPDNHLNYHFIELFHHHQHSKHSNRHPHVSVDSTSNTTLQLPGTFFFTTDF